jgi:hypothetical protein
MATATKKPQTVSAYDSDFQKWTKQQGQALAARRSTEVDWDNVAEEIESLGRSDKREIENRLNIILVYLLKWKYQASRRNRSWAATLLEQRKRIRKLIRESPSLESYPAQVTEEEYEIAAVKAAAETGMDHTSFPGRCPFSTEEILDFGYLPDH